MAFEFYGSGMRDTDRNLRIRIDRVAGPHRLKERWDRQTYFLWYQSAEADISSQYYLAEEKLPYTKNGEALEADYRPIFLVPQRNLRLPFMAQVSRHRGGELPSAAEVDQLYKDVAHVLYTCTRRHAEGYSIAIPDTKIEFAERVSSDDEAVTLLDAAVAKLNS